MPFHIGPHISLERTLPETLSFFETENKKFSPSCIQTFPGISVSYNLRKFRTESYIQAGEFLAANNKVWYVHAPYVINLASQDEEILSRGRACIQKVLDNQALLYTSIKTKGSKVTGTVLHIGAKGPLSQVIREINDLNVSSHLYLENASQPKKLGSTLEDLRLLKEGIDSHKVGFCWDTCHLHSSCVVDMRDPDAVIEFFDEMKDIGVKHYQGVIHLNDSKTAFKSGQDRHAVLGYGTIWNVEKPESMESLFALRDICKEESYDIILETPSIDIEEFEIKILKT